MSLAVTGALLDGERVGLRCEDGLIAAIGPGVAPAARRRDDRRRRRPPRARPGQRPHPRGDDAVPRLRRRPAADALAGGADLAGRGEARRRGRLLGHAARLRGDDPHRNRPLLGHVLAAGGDRAGGRATPGCGRRSAARSSTTTATPSEIAALGPGQPRGARRLRARRDRPAARPPLDLHGQRGARCAGPPSSAPNAGCRSRSTSPRRRRRSRTASPPTANAPPPTSTGSGCSTSARSSPTASGSTPRSSR